MKQRGFAWLAACAFLCLGTGCTDDVVPEPAVEDPFGCGVGDCDVLYEFGEPCLFDEDCASGICVHAGSTTGFCSELCTGDCTRDGFACQVLVSPGNERHAVCYPDDAGACEPCEGANDCGGPDAHARCIEMADGAFCAQQCEGGDLCPLGYTCETHAVPGNDVLKLCVPLESVCDDCAGADFLTDINNCGWCGNICETENGTAACVDGFCVTDTCDDGWADCDTFAHNGCETDLSETCGECATLEGVPGEACGACDSGVWQCNGTDAVVCAGDLGDDAINVCGGCMTLPEAPGTTCGTCGSGEWTCNGTDAVVCSGDGGDAIRNTCGGCGDLGGEPGAACGACDTGVLACSEDGRRLTCVGAIGDEGLNACGGCTTLLREPGGQCGRCFTDRWVCIDPETVDCNLESERDLGEATVLDGGVFADVDTVTLSAHAGPYIVDGHFQVPADKTLRIEPGVLIKAQVHPGNGVVFEVRGVLEAEGTADAPIVFTSLFDDCHGGDTGDDGADTNPSPGDWGGLRLVDTDDSVLRHVQVFYGGARNGLDAAAVQVTGERGPLVAHLTSARSATRGAYFDITGGFAWRLQDSVFWENGLHGVEVRGGSGFLTLERLSVLDNAQDGLRVNRDGYVAVNRLEARDNERGAHIVTEGEVRVAEATVTGTRADGMWLEAGGTLSMHRASLDDIGGVAVVVVAAASDSEFVGLEIGDAAVIGRVPAPLAGPYLDASNVFEDTSRGLHLTQGTVDIPAHWVDRGIVYAVSGHVSVAEDAVLRLDAGVVVKIALPTNGILPPVRFHVSGTVEFDGTPDEPIIVTSLRDDTVAGDTNGDARATTPRAGLWSAIYVAPSGAARLRHTDLRYGSGSTHSQVQAGEGALIVEGEADVVGLTVREPRGHGIRLATVAPVTLALEDVTIHDTPGAFTDLVIFGGAGDVTINGLSTRSPLARTGVLIRRIGYTSLTGLDLSGARNGVEIQEAGPGALAGTISNGAHGVHRSSCGDWEFDLTFESVATAFVGCQ